MDTEEINPQTPLDPILWMMLALAIAIGTPILFVIVIANARFQ